ncbi:MAG: hypothetical protein B0D92_01000 [Spirochaeta sp. LUC14_002_19_P3]|nr:MAG: hypothetical protein B0D92_01000 [Spirochaeta sp. LUC14_002_19_P3]
MNLLEGSFEERLRKSISFAWQVFMEKTGTGLLTINKKASMQLQYSDILQQVVPLICFKKDETVKIELKKGVKINGRSRKIDLILDGINSRGCHRIAVEMRCYRTLASSGWKREATDIFMKDVYEDLSFLEEYCNHAGFNRGVALVMNDMKRFVSPKKKNGKCWDYDISHGTKTGDVHLTTPIGGNQIDIRLKKSYEFTWLQKGQFWFLENEGL